MESGDLENAQHSAEEALEISQNNDLKLAEGLSWILLGRILNKFGKTQKNKQEGYIVKGIKIIEDLKLKPFYAQGYHYLGELCADTGQKEKALEKLNKAKTMFQEMEMDLYFNKTQEVLARL
jgi:tetratricopeptide (TPR) repeat protein